MSGKLSWNHYLEFIKVKNNNKRIFYQKKSVINSWSIRELRKQIKIKLYEKTSLKEREQITSAKLPVTTSDEAFKDALNFDFIQLPTCHKENELEAKIMQNIKHFLKELGPDFYFGGQQVPIKIAGKTNYIDLVLYNRAIPCIVLVELKARQFNNSDVGQINTYLNYFIENNQYEYEKNAIGLIICKETESEDARYALGNMNNKIFLAKYKTKLPSEDKIKKIIHKL